MRDARDLPIFPVDLPSSRMLFRSPILEMSRPTPLEKQHGPIADPTHISNICPNFQEPTFTPFSSPVTTPIVTPTVSPPPELDPSFITPPRRKLSSGYIPFDMELVMKRRNLQSKSRGWNKKRFPMSPLFGGQLEETEDELKKKIRDERTIRETVIMETDSDEEMEDWVER